MTGGPQDDVGFTRFVNDRQRALLRLATALTGDPHHAQDIVADVLARAYEQWHRIGRVDRIDAYVNKMVVNEFMTRQRRWRRAAPYADLTAVAEATGATLDHAAVHAERAALIVEIGKLPRRQRAAIVLRYFEDLPDTEIATMLGCAVGTVRSLISRALAALRIELDGAARPARLLTAEEA